MVHFVCQRACGAGIYSSCLTQTKYAIYEVYESSTHTFSSFHLGRCWNHLEDLQITNIKALSRHRLKKNIASAAWSLDGPAARPGKNTASSCIQICVSLEIAQARFFTQQIGWINGCCHHPRDRLGDPNPRGTGQFPPDSPSWNHLRPPLRGAQQKRMQPSAKGKLSRSLIPPNDCQIVYIYILPIGWLYVYIYIISPTTKKSNHGNQSLTEDFLHEGMSMTSVPRDVSCDLIRSDFRCWGVEVFFFSDGHVDEVDEVRSVQIQPAEFISRKATIWRCKINKGEKCTTKSRTQEWYQKFPHVELNIHVFLCVHVFFCK